MMCGRRYPWANILFSLALLLVLLGAAWPGAVQGQGAPLNPDLAHVLNAQLQRGPAGPLDLSIFVGARMQSIRAPTWPGSAEPTDLAQWSRLAFSSYLYWNWEVYTAAGDGAWPTRLTNNGDMDIFPKYNRGASQITFVSMRDGNLEVYKMNADGSGVTRLTWTGPYEYWPTWSPDGTSILFHSYADGEGDAEIMRMNADGSGQVQITSNRDWDGYPTWSPDGSKIAFISLRTGHYEIWTMDPDGSNQEQLSAGLSYAAFLSWSPDGSRIAFNDDYNDDGWLDLALIRADGTGLEHPLGPSPSHYKYMAPAWAPHGEDLVFARVHWINSVTWDEGDLYGLHLDTGTTYPLVDVGYEWWPDWQTTDVIVPSSRVADLPAWSGADWVVNWSGSDGGGAGLRSYDVQYRDGPEGVWTDWLLDTTWIESAFAGADGHSYYFRSRARDNAHNLEAYPDGDGDTVTTVDILPPSTAASSPAYATSASFAVTWSGIDVGSGIASYDVQYRDGSAGAWTDWLVGTSQSAATFDGMDGHSYYFRSRGRDNRGNEEVYPGGDGDSETLVDLSPPVSSASSPAYAGSPTFAVSWSGSDAGAGIASYDVQYKDGPDGTWTDWRIGTTATGALFPGELGRQYYFQCRARDHVGNLESYPGGAGDTLTHTPLYALSGHVMGNREQPVSLAVPWTTPPALNAPRSWSDGFFSLYYNWANSVALTVTRAGFGLLPPMLGLAPAEGPEVTLYLPPLDDRIVEGGFEGVDLSAWWPAGQVSPVLASTAHTGGGSVLLGGPVPPPLVTPTVPFSASAVFTAAGGSLVSPPVVVVVPPGAVSGTMILTLTGVPTVSGLPLEMQDVGLHIAWTAVRGDGSPISATLLPLTLTLAYEDAAWQSAQVAGEGTLLLWRYEPISVTWQPLSSTVDPLSNMVTVATVEPGLLALLGSPYAGPWRSTLEQEVVLSPALVSGTVSLLYRVVGVEPTSDTLWLALVGATRTLSYTLPLTGSGWVHHWAVVEGDDPTATLRLEWRQGGREGSSGVLLDEISLGSAAVGGYSIYLPLTQNSGN